jgi:bifunctional DNA primase/polymerase-like protein
MTALPTDIKRLALLGWRLYPASRRNKAACIKDPGASATFDLDKLQAWTRAFPDCNWRMVCEGSGVWALDVDVPPEDHDADGVAALADLVKRHSPIPPRPMTRSGGGGLALFFRHSGEPIHGATGWPVPGINPRRGKLSVTVPPSIHVRTRRPYVWAVAPWEVSPPDAPGWLLPARRAVVVSDGIHNADPARRSRYAEAALRGAGNEGRLK